MFILHSRESDGGAFTVDESSPTLDLTVIQALRLTFDFFPSKLGACSKPPASRIIIVKLLFQGRKNVARGGLNSVHAIRVVVKTTPYPFGHVAKKVLMCRGQVLVSV